MRTHAKRKQALRTREPPALDPSLNEALDAFMARRKVSRLAE